MGNGKIVVEREGAIAHVELARPEKLNAMDGAFFAALGETFRGLGSDSGVRAILLSGRGRHFTAGLDLNWAAGQFAPSPDAGRWSERQHRDILALQAAVNAVEEARPPVIVAVHGGCIGGGVDLACACDLRVASSDAWFQVAEVDVAITADLGTLQRLPHLIPGGIVRELALTGRRMDADEAARWGLVNRVVADREAAIAAGLELAGVLAAKSPMAVAGTKASLNHGRGRTVADGMAQVALWNAATLANGDLHAIFSAKATGTPPAFADLD